MGRQIFQSINAGLRGAVPRHTREAGLPCAEGIGPLINAQLGGSRRCILVSNNEPGEKVARKLAREGIFPGDPNFENVGVAERVMWPRVKYSINGKRDDGTALQGKYLELKGYSSGFSWSSGFSENIEYFRLNFLDPNEVARGDALNAIIPILWMMAGCRGERENPGPASKWFIPKRSPFAVLIDEKQFRAFRAKLAARSDIDRVFLVTDSEENFASMRRELGRGFECVQLYKSYLENFRINTLDTLSR